MSQAQAMNDVQLKRSWKMPVVYVLAALLQILFALKVSGDVTIRLNDKSQSLNIDDIVTPGRPKASRRSEALRLRLSNTGSRSVSRRQ